MASEAWHQRNLGVWKIQVKKLVFAAVECTIFSLDLLESHLDPNRQSFASGLIVPPAAVETDFENYYISSRFPLLSILRGSCPRMLRFLTQPWSVAHSWILRDSLEVAESFDRAEWDFAAAVSCLAREPV